MDTKGNAAGDKPHRKGSWGLLGSRSYLESNGDLEEPATSWPKRRSG